MKFTMKEIGKLLAGSQLLGCGGGGDFNEGYQTAMEAVNKGTIELITVEELAARGEEGIIVTISGVGSPASADAYYSTDVYPLIIKALQEKVNQKIIGFIACEIGGSSSFEPFIPAALLGVPVIDAPCDGRAHPLGLMGALGLEKTETSVWQAAAGGKKENHKYIELVVNGSVESASNLIRNAAAEAGGAVAVARNPVDIAGLKDAGAKGAYQQAMALGELWNGPGMIEERVKSLAEALHGEVVCSGRVSDFILKTDNALDRGSFKISGDGKECVMHFFNEYMTLDVDGVRKNTFPDAMMTIDAHKGTILTTADIKDDLDVHLITTKRENILIGKGLRYRASYEKVQDIIGVNMTNYVEDILLD